MLISLLITALLSGQAEIPDLPVALVIEYADGRRTSTVLGGRPHRSWTPMFPRIAGWHPPEGGQPVAAIQHVAVREGDAIRVRISVLFGRPHRRETDVAEVLVVRGRTIRIDELLPFGVEPVLLSLAPVGPLSLFPPNVETPADGLEVTVDLIAEPPPRYRISVRNRSDKGVAGLGVRSSRDGRPALSTQRGDPFGETIVPAGETYRFDLTNSGRLLDGPGPVSPEPFDTIAITFVLWEDGTWAGDERDARQQLAFEAARRGKLLRIVPLLHAARAAAPNRRSRALAALRDELAREPYDLMARTLLGDLEQLEEAAAARGDAFGRLAGELHGRYIAAIERLAARAATSRR